MTPPGAVPRGRLVFVRTGAGVAPGLLTASAWDLLRVARVFAATTDHPQAGPLRDAGITVEARSELDPAGLLAEAAGSTVAWLVGAGEDHVLVEPVLQEAAQRRARGADVPTVDTLVASPDQPGWQLIELVAVMDRLRSPGGCPWDAQQTHRSLATYLVEETYETLEAIETGDHASLREELGDLLLQVVFHARIAQEHEDEPWSVDEVAAGLVDKLVARHPHVFGDAHAPTAEHVEARWELMKRAEKQRRSALDGVPLAQPALSLATKVIHRARMADVPVPLPPVDLPQPDPAGIGDLLFAVAGAASELGIDPEQALRDGVRRFTEAVRAAELEAGLPDPPRPGL